MSYAPPAPLRHPDRRATASRPRVQPIPAVLRYDVAARVWCLGCPQLGIFTEGGTREEAIAVCLRLVPDMEEGYGFSGLTAQDLTFITGEPVSQDE
jgi:hypothetical protein